MLLYSCYFTNSYFTDPQYAEEFPMDYLEKVKTIHSVGGYGSQGYKIYIFCFSCYY